VLKSKKEESAAKQNQTTTEIVNIRVPKDLILELDGLVKRRVFNSRSEAIREFAREYVQEQANSLHRELEKTENAKISERGGRGW
jgi:metal-responsive CopG/Arc/MetJ family transcriptional regulator